MALGLFVNKTARDAPRSRATRRDRAHSTGRCMTGAPRWWRVAGMPTARGQRSRARRWLWALPVMVVVAGAFTRGLWLPSIGHSLVCREEVARADAILVENFDPDYRLFERAAALQEGGLSARVLVPTRTASSDSEEANLVSKGVVELMARLARVQRLEIVPIREIEPYTLNAASQIRDFLTRAQVRSILVISPALRSRRSSAVYRAVLQPAGIQVHCLPIFGPHTPENWTASWHGIQTVTEQFIKLQFYRFYAVP